MIPGLLDAEQTSTIDLRGQWRCGCGWSCEVQGLFVPLMIRALSPGETPGFGPMPAALKARIEGAEATHRD